MFACEGGAVEGGLQQVSRLLWWNMRRTKSPFSDESHSRREDATDTAAVQVDTFDAPPKERGAEGPPERRGHHANPNGTSVYNYSKSPPPSLRFPTRSCSETVA